MASSTEALALRATPHMSDNQTLSESQLNRIKKTLDNMLVSNVTSSISGAALEQALRTQDRERYLASVFPFLDLPTEVRNMIYGYTLVVGKVFSKARTGLYGRYKDQENYERPNTQLFLVSRQVFKESAPMFFAKNLFVIHYGRLSSSLWGSKDDLQKGHLSRLARENVRSLSVKLPGVVCDWVALSEFLDLRLVEIHVETWTDVRAGHYLGRTQKKLLPMKDRSQTRWILSGIRKDAQVKRARDALKSMGLDYILVSEPGTYA